MNIDDDHVCRHCRLPISEGHAYELGGDRWHMYCFSCSKCSKLLGTSSNFMVLGTGDLICSDCSYNCNNCGKKIDDLAILTGDQAYCSTCFCCRNCHKKIEDLRYARTSKGLFCMNCHEKLLEKKKKYDLNKKLLLSNRDSITIDKSLPKLPKNDINIDNNIIKSNEINKSNENDLLIPERIQSPGIPLTATPAKTNLKTNLSSIPPPRSPNRQLNSSLNLDPPINISSTLLNDQESDYDDIDSSYFNTNNNSTNQINEPITTPNLSLLQTPTNKQIKSPLRSNSQKTPNGDINRKAVIMDSISASSSNNLLSSYINNSNDLPPKLPFNIIKNDNTSNNLEDGESIADDFIDMNDTTDNDDDIDDIDDDEQSEIGSVYLNKEEQEELDLKNRLVNNHPASYSSLHQKVKKPQDLQINKQQEEKEQNDHYNSATPIINQNNITSPFKQQQEQQVPSQQQDHTSTISPNNKKNQQDSSILSRSKSIKSPKNFLNNFNFGSSKHKKSESSSSMDYKISSPFLTPDNIFFNKNTTSSTTSNNNNNNNNNIFDHTPRTKSIDSPRILQSSGGAGAGAASFQTPPFEGSSYAQHQHQRHFSNGSYSASASSAAAHKRSVSSSAGTSNNNHIRSRSDVINSHDNQLSGGLIGGSSNDERRSLELELRLLKVEIMEMKQTKGLLMKDILELSSKKDVLNQEILSISNNLNNLKLNDNNENIDKNIEKNIENDDNKIAPLSQPPLINEKQQQFPQPQQQNSQNSQNSQTSNISNPTQLLSSPFPTSLKQSHQLNNSDNSTNDKKSRKFWKRGIFKSDNNNLSNSQSSYSINNLLNNDNHNNNSGDDIKQLISEPFLKTEELDELGGNDNKKLSLNILQSNPSSNSNSNSQQSKYIDLISSNQSKSSSSEHSSQITLPQQQQQSSSLIMSDLFNSTLESRAIFEKRSIPLIITRLVKEVENNGLDLEGIYRKNGGTSQMNLILNNFNNLYHADTSYELEKSLEGDINAITSSLKRYLYFILPEPIIPQSQYEEFIKIDKLTTSKEKINQFIKIFKNIPITNLKTLEFLLKHFRNVENHSNLNKMNFYNLSVVFGPTFTRVSSSERELMDMKSRNNVMEFLLRNSEIIFKDL